MNPTSHIALTYSMEYNGENPSLLQLSHMWNIPINIITATKYWMIKLFHESDNTDIVVIVNGYYGTSTKCTHYAATELIVPDQNKVPGNATPYDDLIPVNLTNQQEACKSAISYAQCCTHDHILTEFHNISRGMVILKGEMKKMDMRYNKLEKM